MSISNHEPAAADILERLTYHALERDDMTIDDLLQTLSKDGYRNVRQRSHRQLELQLLALLAGLATEEAGVQADPAQEMLDMLGRVHPHAQPYYGAAFKQIAYERLRRPLDLQQPWPVPDQAAIVWRADLMAMDADLDHKQAAFEDYKRLLAHLRTAHRASQDVLAERRRQVEQEGYDPAHDDEHQNDEIAAYAAVYAMPQAARQWPASETGYGDTLAQAMVPEGWAIPPDGDRRRELIKAGALILAEIERLDRAASSGEATREDA